VSRCRGPATWLVGSLPALRLAAVALAAILSLTGCDTASSGPTPRPTPGTSDHPRELNLIASEYAYAPSGLDVVPGETVLLHVVNAGLDVHEAIIGDAATQAAWESAESAVAGAPPGPTPVVSLPSGIAGLRAVVRSGERVDVTWLVPATPRDLIVGCHIPGHWARGMQVPVNFMKP
jgi:uncharacterized cupredoxin-like copper-binding protein